MPTNKSPGPDKINMRVIKYCLPVILGPLTDIINCTLVTSTFPDMWKDTEVIPLHKREITKWHQTIAVFHFSSSFQKFVKEPISSAKDLGVTLDSHLIYDCHIAKLVSSCMTKLCQINRVKDTFDNDTLLAIIGGLVISKLLYFINVWSNTSYTNIKRLQAVQNFVCRIITKTKKFDHVTPALQQLNWLPVEQLLLYRNTILTYKCFNDCAQSYLCNFMFSKRSETHDYTTRNRSLLKVPLFRIDSDQRTFYYRAAKIWNKLNNEL